MITNDQKIKKNVGKMVEKRCLPILLHDNLTLLKMREDKETQQTLHI